MKSCLYCCNLTVTCSLIIHVAWKKSLYSSASQSVCLHLVSLYLSIKTIKGNLNLNDGDCTAQHYAASSLFCRIISQTLTWIIRNTSCCHGAFRCCRKHFPLSSTRLQWLPLYPRHPPFHDEAGLSLLSVLLLHFCLPSLKVNLFSSLRGLSTSRIIFCVSWQFCVCGVTSVCFGIRAVIEHICDIYIILRSSSSEYFDSLSCMCLCFYSFISCWLPVSTRDGSATQQTALQLFSRSAFTRERWDVTDVHFKNLHMLSDAAVHCESSVQQCQEIYCRIFCSRDRKSVV